MQRTARACAKYAIYGAKRAMATAAAQRSVWPGICAVRRCAGGARHELLEVVFEELGDVLARERIEDLHDVLQRREHLSKPSGAPSGSLVLRPHVACRKRPQYLGEHGRACGVLVQQRRTLLQQREQWRLDDLQRALHT